MSDFYRYKWILFRFLLFLERELRKLTEILFIRKHYKL